MRKSIAVVSEETLKIQSYLGTVKDGETVDYRDIERGSTVKMDNAGKQKLRSALRRAKREYSPIRGIGIKLACPDMVVPILGNRIIRIDNAVKRADKTHKALQVQFFSSLTTEQQKQILFAGAVFGAIRIAAENGKMIYRKGKEGIGQNSIRVPIPDITG